MKQWYEALFENYAKKYDEETFTFGTQGECDFLEKEIEFDKAVRILDVGCGTGRHSIELAKRGYKVTGVDLSDSQLARAREKAKASGVSVDFRKQDARELKLDAVFGLVIMLCEGGFPLMETDEMNYDILKGAASCLAPAGKLVFTTLNGLFPLFHSVKDFLASDTAEGNWVYTDLSFDLMTFREHCKVSSEDDAGNKRELVTNERYYVPSEITWLLKTLGFTAIDIFGAKLGAFSRSDRLTTDDYEMLVVAGK
jgi:SAM-dependent methyltransferase